MRTIILKAAGAMLGAWFAFSGWAQNCNNCCVETGPHFTSISCTPGQVTSHGALNWTATNVCAGSTVIAPLLTSNIAISSATQVYWVTYDCSGSPPAHYQTNIVNYSIGSLYFVPTNVNWPSITGPFNTPGTYVYTAQVNGTAGGTSCSTMVVTVATVTITVTSSPPVILSQPQSQTVPVGTNVTFTVIGSGCPSLAYQWRFNATNVIANATSASLTITNVQLTNAGNYTVVLTDASGSVTSAVAVLTVYVPQCDTPPSGLIGWWKGESNAVDSVAGNNGTTQNITYTSGVVGTAFACDPENYPGGYVGVKIPDNPAYVLTNAFSIEAWARPRQAGYVIFWRGDNRPGLDPYSLSMQANNHVRFYITDASGNSPYVDVPLVYNQWWHLVATFDATAGVMKLYTNGVLAGQTNTSIIPIGNLIAGDSPGIGIGNVNDGQNNFPFLGDIDEASLYSRALTASEVASLYYAGTYGKCPILITATGPTNVTTCPGEPVTFNVSAAGCGPISYVWKFGTNTLVGQTGSSLTLSNVYSGNAGTYSVIVSGPCGSKTNSATLSVLTNLSVAGPIDLSVCAGSTAVFSVTAFGSGPFTYQWSFGTNLLSGQTNSSLTITNVGPANAGTYSVTVSGACGTVTQSAVLRTFAITSQPGNQTVTYGQNATFNVVAAGYSSPSYQWRRNGHNIAGATGSSYTVVQPTVAQSGDVYDVIAWSPYCSQTSSGATLTVNRASLLVSADNQTRSYGTTNPPLTWTATGFVFGETTAVLTGVPTLSTTATTNSPVGSYPISISAGTLSAANYSLTFTNGTLTVAKTPLTIIADNKTRLYGAANPPFTWRAFGFVNGETTNVSSGAPQLSTTATTNSAVGSYAITIAQNTLTCTNYSLVFSNGTLTVTMASLTVSADSKTRLTGTANPPLTGSVVGVLNNDNITATFSTPAISTSPAGVYPIVPTLIDPNGKLPNYSVSSINGTLTVTDSPPFIVTQPPATITTNVGSTLSISVVAGGTQPLGYAWLFNGTAISGATGTNYTKVLAATDGGNYSARVANAAGSVTSAPTVVTVIVPASITAQPSSQTVAQGTNVNLTVSASGSGTLAYQWCTNGTALANNTKYSGVTTSSLWVTNVSSADAMTYTVTVTNVGGSMTSAGAVLTVVKMSRISIDGSNPEVNTTNVVVSGVPVTFRAIPASAPGAASFPAGYPVWSNAPAGATFANGSPTLTLTNPAAGLYQFSAWCGSSVTNFSLLAVNTTDSDYDGVGDWQEILDGTDPNNPNSVLPRLMGSWRFDTTNWAGVQGQTPMAITNLNLVPGVVSNAVSFNTNKQAYLVYAEANSAIANINCRKGSVSLWFRPDWSSATAGTGPTNEARLIEFGTKGTTNGCWGLYINAKGTNLYFCSETNGTSVAPITTNVNATINWTSNYWHFIALTYSTNKVRLFIDGVPVATNGVGVTNWPGLSVRANGFCVGSSRDGTNQCRGRIDDLDTCDYDRDDDDVDNQYVGTCFSAMDAELVIDQSGSMADPGSPGHTKLQDAQQASTNFVNSLNFNLDQAGVVSFSSASTNRQTLTNNAAPLIKAITNLVAGGSTSIYSGITNAQAELTSVRHHSLSLPVMVILTDGSNNPASLDSSTIQAATAAKNAGTRIITVGLGSGADTNLLQQLASTTNLFYYATNSSQLNSIYGLIAGFLCRSTNLSPTVQIINPSSNQVFNFPAPVPIQATATDPQRSLTSVSFYAGSTFLSLDQHPITNSLYGMTWSNATPGRYLLTAVASNSFGLSATSAPVPIIINGQPVINITNQTLIWNESSTSISTNLASSSDDGLPNNILTNGWSVLSSNGPVVFGNPTVAGTTITFSNFGTYVLQLTAGDGAATTTSNATVVIKRRPFVWITAPTNNAAVDASVGVAINASAYDLDGFVPTNGVLFLDVAAGITNTLGTATYAGNNGITNLYGFEWTNNVPAGAHTLYAVATDNDGLSKTSAPINITVYQAVAVSIAPTNPSVCSGVTVTLTANATGSAPLSYSWSKGGFPMNITTASLVLTNVGVGDSAVYNVKVSNSNSSASAATTLVVSPATTAVGPTNVSALAGQNVTLSTVASGGGTLGYVWRKNGTVMSGQSGPSVTITNAGAGDAAVYTVEVTGSCGSVTNSATLSLDLPPTIYIVMPADNAQEAARATIQLNSVAQDDGIVTNVVYYMNGTFIGSNSVSPYTLVIPGVLGSTNVFQAIAYDDKGLTGSSPLVTNVVIKQPPTVQIFVPHSNDVFVTGGNVLIGARASDVDGVVTSVQFKISGGSLGTVTTAVSNNLYYFTWTNAPQTALTNLSAIATDNDGLTATSSVPITVQAGCAFPTVSSLALSVGQVLGGQTLAGTVSLSSAAPASGEAIAVSSSSQFVGVPPIVVVPGNATSVSFDITTTPDNATNVALISAGYHNQNTPATASLTVTPGPNSLNGGADTNGDDVLISGNNAGGGNEPIETFGYPSGALVNSFIPDQSAAGGNGRAIAVSGNEIFYTETTGSINVAPYGIQGSGGSDVRTLPNPPDQVGAIVALSFFNGSLYALAGYGESSPQVFKLDPTTGEVLAGPIEISGPANGNDPDGFAVLPDGNFLINDDDGGNYILPSVYREYDGTTGNWITNGLTITLADFGLDGGTGVTVDPDGASLYIVTGVNDFGFSQQTIVQTDLKGNLLNAQQVNAFDLEGIAVVRAHPDESSGPVILVRDDLVRTNTPFSVSAPRSGGARMEFARFDAEGYSGSVMGARMLRAGAVSAAAGTSFDAELGTAATGGQFSSFGILLTNASVLGTAHYSVEWALPDALLPTLQSQLSGTCSLLLTDALSSICGTAYSLTDQPQQQWPVEKDILTLAVRTPHVVPQGRCRDLVLTGLSAPINGTWDVVFRNHVIASSGQPNGWDVEADHTAFGGFIVTAPSAAVMDQGYEVRVSQPDWDTGRSSSFGIVQSNSIYTAPVLLPLVLSTNTIGTSGATISLTVALDAPAPFGDAYVTLTGPSIAGLPPWVVIPAGQTSVTTNIQIAAGSPGALTINASFNGYRQAKVLAVGGCQKPATPSIQSIGTNNLGIILNWSPVSGATGYNIFRGTNVNNLTLFFSGLTTTNFLDTEVLPQITYYYQVITLSNLCQSDPAQTNFTLPYPFAAPAPFIIPFGGTFNDSVSVSITNLAAGAVIYYTTNGSQPTTSSDSFVNGGVVLLTSNAVVKAYTAAQFVNGGHQYDQDSHVVSANFTVVRPTPVDCGSTNVGTLSTLNPYSTVFGPGFFCNRFVFTAGVNDVGKLVTVTASSADFDTFLFLKDTSTNVLQWNDDYLDDSTDSQIAFRLQQTGTYIFEVTSYSPQEVGAFTLTVDCENTAELNVLTNAYPFLTNGVVLPEGGKIDFGLIPLSTVVTNYVTVTNSGKGDLVISNIAIYPTAATNNGNGFSISPTNTMTIPAGGVTNLAVTLASTNLGSFDGYFIFDNNDSGSGSMPPEEPFWAEVLGNVGAAPGQPLVNIFYPTNGQVIPATNGTITNVVLEIDAIAIDANGIQKVEFYTNNALFTTLTAAPYTAYWTNPPAGQQTISVKAYDLPQPTHIGQASVTISVGAPSLTLSPTNACVGLSNTTFTATATLRNISGGLVTGSNVVFTVSGAHNFAVTNVTGANGQATLTYTGTNAGLDQIVATATVNGLPAQSGIISKEWAMPISCGNIYNGALTNTDGFSIACGCAVPSHYTDFYSITGSAGDTITLTMTSTNFGTYMFLMDTNCNKLSTTVQALDTNDTRVVYTLPSNGTYVVEATSADIFKTGNYTLSPTCGTPPVAPQIAVLVSGTNMPDYGVLNLGTTNNTQSLSSVITITNTGTATLNITGWSLYYGFSSIFSVTPSPITILPPGGSTNITVQFQSANTGQYLDALVITNNDPNQNPFVLNVTGISNPNGTPPTVSITSPTNGANFIAPAAVPITATATANGTGLTITNVAFVFTTSQGTFLVGSVTNAPYTITWSEQLPGNYALQAVAYDSQGRISASAPVNVSVYPSTLNHPPVAVNDHPIVGANTANNILDVLANDSDPDGDSLTITKIIPPSTPGPHGTPIIVDNGKHISYTPVPFYSSPDTNTPADGFTYEISDGKGGTARAGVYVVVFASRPPTIHIANPPSGSTLTAGTVTNVTVTLGPVESLPYIARVDYFVGEDFIGSVTNAPFTVFPWYVRGNDCGCGLKARVTDIFGQFSEDAATYTIVPPANAATPYAAIDSPAELPLDVLGGTSSKTAVVEDGLLVVTGSVYQVTNTGTTTITNAAEYKVLIKTTDGTVLRDTGWLPAALIRDGVINTNDLTTLQNDKYVLELIARSAYQTATKDVPFILDSNLKIGVFTFSQQDMVIPAGGIPLAVTRTYNSLNPDAGDFGYSWTYALDELDVKFDEIRAPQCPLDVFDEGPAYNGGEFSLRVGGSRDVTLTLPDGQRTTFYYNEVAGQCNAGDEANLCAFPSYYAPPDVHYALQPVDENGNDLGGYDLFLRIWQKGGGETAHDAFDFPAFILTDTRDGTQYFIKRDYQGEFSFLAGDCGGDSGNFFGDPTDSNFYVKAYSGAHLAWIRLASGEKIVINPPTSGPTGSQFSVDYLNAAGNTNRSIYLQRNANGQISAIMDPISGSAGLPVVKYEYDSITNLIRVERLIDRLAQTYSTNTYLYEDGKFPHFITKILDSRGIPTARNLYDDSGKLIGVVDPAGKTNLFVHSVSGQTETVFDRAGNKTVFVYDSRGNVTTTIDALGRVTQATYDSQNNVTSQTDALTNTTYFAYDDQGHRTQTVDPMGHTNLFSYDSNGNLLTHTDPQGNVSENRYDSSGHLTNTIQYDARMNVLGQTFSVYDDAGHLLQTSNGTNVTTTFNYDLAGNVTNRTDGANFSFSFSYDADGHPMSSTHAGTDANGNTVLVTKTSEYDAQGRTTHFTAGNTNDARTAINGDGLQDYVVDKFNHTNTFTYDSAGHQIETKYWDGSVARTVYDDNGHIILETQRNFASNTVVGVWSDYNGVGRVTRTVRLHGVRVDIISDPNNPGQVESTVTSLGTPVATNSTEYYENDLVKAQIAPDGGRTSFEYWPNGQLMAVTDALSNRTFYAYDDAGRQTLEWDALNHPTHSVYDGAGRRTSTIFADGSSVSNAFDDLGQLVTTVDQAGQATRFDYAPTGELQAVTKPPVLNPTNSTSFVSPVWSFSYNISGRPIITTDPNGNSTTNIFDQFGRQIGSELARGGMQSNVFDSYGRLWKQYDFKKQWMEFVYDGYGRVKAKFLFGANASSPSNSVCYQYNEIGQLTNVIERYGADASTNSCDGYFALVCPNGARPLESNSGVFRIVAKFVKTSVRWSAPATAVVMVVLLLVFVPGGRKLRLLLAQFYLQGGWQLEFIQMAAKPRRFRMPSVFWRATTLMTLFVLIVTDPAWDRLFEARAQCTFPYNPSTPTTRVTSYVYDVDGRVTQINSPEGVINYGYDLATGRETSICTTNSYIQYGYDLLGRLTTVTVLKRASQFLPTPEVTTYTYDALGNRTSTHLPNGIITSYLYDNLNRLTNMTHQVGVTNLASYSYTVDATGRRTGAVEILRQDDNTYLTNTLIWQYDGMYRLTNEVSLCSAGTYGYTNRFQYDLAGNRLKQTRLTAHTTVITNAYDGNDQLLREVTIVDGAVSGTNSYAYDANGSLIGQTNSNGTVTYEYDLANRLSSVTAGNNTASFEYNDQGVRVRKSGASGSEYFLVDQYNRTGVSQVLEELNAANGTLIMSYVIGDDVLAQAVGQTASYLLYDGHGSTRQLMGSPSGVTADYSYEAYGATTASSSSTAEGSVTNGVTSKLYCGEQYDADLHMYNLRSRNYDPSSGRFNQRDTFAGVNSDPQSLHKYLYAHADPVNNVDPSGHFIGTLLDILSVVGIIATVVAITFKAIQIVNNLKALNELVETNILLNQIDEVEPEFAIEYAYYSFFQALKLISQIAKLGLSIIKEVVCAYSACVALMFMVKDFVWGDDADSDTPTPGTYDVAQNEQEYNSFDPVINFAAIGRGLRFENRIFGLARNRISVLFNGALHISDDSNKILHGIEEAKSVRRLSLTRQLRAFIAHAAHERAAGDATFQFILHVDGSVISHVSQTVWDAVRNGDLVMVIHP